MSQLRLSYLCLLAQYPARWRFFHSGRSLGLCCRPGSQSIVQARCQRFCDLEPKHLWSHFCLSWASLCLASHHESHASRSLSDAWTHFQACPDHALQSRSCLDPSKKERREGCATHRLWAIRSPCSDEWTLGRRELRARSSFLFDARLSLISSKSL